MYSLFRKFKQQTQNNQTWTQCFTEQYIIFEPIHVKIVATILKYQIDKVDNTNRHWLFRKEEKSNKDIIPCLITNNKKLLMMRKIIQENWYFIEKNLDLQEIFEKNPLLVFKWSKILKLNDVIWSKMEKP